MASKTIRLLNFLLDTIFYLLFMVFFFRILRDIIDRNNVKWISIVAYFLYYLIFELINGRTVGKIITRSKVVSNTIVGRVTFFQIIGRTSVRLLVLFDALSFLFFQKGLHDWISKTTVVKL